MNEINTFLSAYRNDCLKLHLKICELRALNALVSHHELKLQSNYLLVFCLALEGKVTLYKLQFYLKVLPIFITTLALSH